MPNTILSDNAKRQLTRVLGEEGHATYAWLLEPFDVYLTDDPDVVGYMVPNQAKIVLNELLDTEQVSTIVRHELLHEWLTHAQRTQKFDKEHPDRITNHDIANIAADFEISNRSYTEKDKRNSRRLKMGNQILRGLVTEDQYPGWEDMTFEEMYDKLTDEYTKDMKKMQKELQPLIDKLNKLSPQELDKLIDQAQQQSQDQQGEGQQGEGNPSGLSKKSSSNKEQSGEEGGRSNQQDSQKDSKEAKDLQKEADKARDQLQGIKDKSQEIKDGQDGPFGDNQDQRDQIQLAKKVAEIQRRLSDIKRRQDALDEDQELIRKEKIQAVKDKEYRNITSSLNKFRMNFQRFIKDQIDYFRGDTWNRPNKNYAGTGIIMPGKTMYAPGKIPTINVYWDVSGSFDNPAKTQGAKDAIGTVNQYVKKGDIKVNIFYFAERVSNKASSAGGGTDGDAVLDHIEETKPTNVIVITDSDVNNAKDHNPVTVPGAVWMLFYDEEADEFAKVLRGKAQTKEYLIEY